ncbi:hypothetical protein LG58_1075 [Kosakonia radicincitans YD4]|jgi:hypothetical protein|nr:hypothetical protein LG58_1075 [Kosakonia radicincitans YD4]
MKRQWVNSKCNPAIIPDSHEYMRKLVQANMSTPQVYDTYNCAKLNQNLLILKLKYYLYTVK